MRKSDADALFGRDMEPLEVRSWSEYRTSFAPMLTYSPLLMVVQLARENQITIWHRDHTFFAYDDAAFGPVFDSIHLNYNSEIGLHVDQSATDRKVYWLVRRIEFWQKSAAMTFLATHSAERGADFLKEHLVRVRASEFASKARIVHRWFGFDPEPPTDQVNDLYQWMMDFRATLPEIPRPEDLYKLIDSGLDQ